MHAVSEMICETFGRLRFAPTCQISSWLTRFKFFLFQKNIYVNCQLYIMCVRTDSTIATSELSSASQNIAMAQAAARFPGG